MRKYNHWHAMPVEDVIRALASDRYKGLSEYAAAKRIGMRENRLWVPRLPDYVPSMRKCLLDYTTVFFAISVALTALFGDTADAFMILALLLVSLSLRAVTCLTSRKVLLRAMEYKTPRCCVLRTGKRRDLFAHQIAEGDIVLLSAGDTVPCDVRLISGYVRVSEIYYSKDRQSISKSADEIAEVDSAWTERSNILFAASTVIDGECVGIVIATGENTYAHACNGKITVTDSAPVEVLAEVRRWSRSISFGMILISMIIVLISLFAPAAHMSLDFVFLSVLALTVSSMSESISVAGIVFFCSTMQRCQRTPGDKCVIKTPSALESIACADAIVFSDERYFLSGSVTVHSWMHTEGIFRELPPGAPLPIAVDNLLQLAELGRLAQTALSSRGSSDRQCEAHRLLDALRRTYPTLENKAEHGRCIESVMYNGLYTSHVEENNRIYAYVYGSLDAVLKCCSGIQYDHGIEPISPEIYSSMRTCVEEARYNNRRTLAVARRISPFQDLTAPAAVQCNMTLIGCVVVDDPLDNSVQPWVQSCRETGVRIVVFCDDVYRAKHTLEVAGVLTENDAAVVYDADSFENLLSKAHEHNLLIQAAPSERSQVMRVLKEYMGSTVYAADSVEDLPCIRLGQSVFFDRGEKRGTGAVSRRSDAVCYPCAASAPSKTSDACRLFSTVATCRDSLANLRCATLYLLVMQTLRTVLVIASLFMDLRMVSPASLLFFGCIMDYLSVMLFAFRRSGRNQIYCPKTQISLTHGKDGVIAALGFGILGGMLVCCVTAIVWKYGWIFDRNALELLAHAAVLCVSVSTVCGYAANSKTAGNKLKAGANWVFVYFVILSCVLAVIIVYTGIHRFSMADIRSWLLCLVPAAAIFAMLALYHRNS